MSRTSLRPLASVGVAGAVTAAIGALVLDSELEVALLMAAAVVAALVCFDTAIARRVDSGVSWVLLSAAPIAKTVPTVIVELRADGAVLPARYDLGGSLLCGLLVTGAVVGLARPAPQLGRRLRIHDAVVIVGCGVLAAAAGASVAFLVDLGFGSATFGRLLETPTWFVVGALLAATAQAAGRSRTLPTALAVVLGTSAVVAAMLAGSVAGASVDLGLWALAFAGLAAGGAMAGPGFGGTADRSRPSAVSAVASMIAGGVAATAAVAARSDPTAWGPGWIVLGVGSLVMFASALVSRPVAVQSPRAQGEIGDEGAPTEQTDSVEHERAVRARERALRSLSSSALDASTPPLETAAEHPGRAQAVAFAPGQSPDRTEPKGTSSATAPQDAPDESRSSALATASSAPLPAASTSPPSSGSSSSLATAHHTDPSTGLLSAAGLQHGLASAFAGPVQAGHVTLMMFVVRNLEQIEARHGRLASAAVTRQVAGRIVTLFPGAAGARFGRAAYGVLFTADLSDTDTTVRQLAEALLRLRAPVDGGTFGDRIDVVAGMAQCYEGEIVSSFIERANQGLARAMGSSEATLVAMP